MYFTLISPRSFVISVCVFWKLPCSSCVLLLFLQGLSSSSKHLMHDLSVSVSCQPPSFLPCVCVCVCVCASASVCLNKCVRHEQGFSWLISWEFNVLKSNTALLWLSEKNNSLNWVNLVTGLNSNYWCIFGEGKYVSSHQVIDFTCQRIQNVRTLQDHE